MPECFDVEVTDGVAHLRLNRPDALNTMTPDFWRELPELLDEIDRNASARVVVLSSTGRHFSAGMDLAVFTGGSDLLTEPGVSGMAAIKGAEVQRSRTRTRAAPSTRRSSSGAAG